MTIHKKTEVSKRKLLAKATKNKIKMTALELFEKYGFDIVTIEDITNEAGVSKGLFYVYYSSKDEIFVNEYKMIDGYYEKAIDTLTETMPVVEQIRFIAKTVFTCCDKIGLHIIRVMYINQISMSSNEKDVTEVKFLCDHNRILYKKLFELFDRGITAGEFKDGITTDTAVKALERVFHGVLYDWCLHNGEFDMVKDGVLNIDFLLDGMTQKK
jgi:AcrR family transcriptional regulator